LLNLSRPRQFALHQPALLMELLALNAMAKKAFASLAMPMVT